MTSYKFLSDVLTPIALLCFAVPTYAHHSFAAEFDANKCMDFNGTLTAFRRRPLHRHG